MFQLDAVDKSFGETAVLTQFDLAITPAQTTVLLGPSGCGKSTILRLMLGLVKPDRGHVLLDGERVTRMNVRTIRRHAGYVIQDGGLMPHMTARQNVTLMARQMQWDRGRITQRLNELCDLTKFPREAMNRYPVELSGGQQQRVALMRALMLDPDALLMDEPLGALDPLIRFDLQTDLRDIFRSLNKTVVLVTHDLSEAAYFADHVVLLREGTIVQQGQINEIVENPADDFVLKFIRAQRPQVQSEPRAR